MRPQIAAIYHKNKMRRPREKEEEGGGGHGPKHSIQQMESQNDKFLYNRRWNQKNLSSCFVKVGKRMGEKNKREERGKAKTSGCL